MIASTEIFETPRQNWQSVSRDYSVLKETVKILALLQPRTESRMQKGRTKPYLSMTSAV